MIGMMSAACASFWFGSGACYGGKPYPPPVPVFLCAELLERDIKPDNIPLPCLSPPRLAERPRRPRRRVLRTWER